MPKPETQETGWYCPECGARCFCLPVGEVRCDSCNGLGLRGYVRRPTRIQCPDHPEWSGWDDGVNDDMERHLRREHVSA
jgi:hypothetical protein